MEHIKLEELEANIKNDSKILCPKCGNDVIIKKHYQVDIPKTIGFVVFLGASFAIVLLINAIIMIRQKLKKRKLPQEIKEKITNEDNISILGLNIPTKIRIVCSKCNYSFYENYD